MDSQFCIYCEVPVKRTATADKTFGKGPVGEFYHVPKGDERPCGRQFLAEHETYTEGDSDGNRPSEAQL